MTPEQAAHAIQPHADQISIHARALDAALTNADEYELTGATIAPAVDRLRQIITAAEAGLSALRPRLTNAA